MENPSGIYQAIDANLNRCAEGLRVAEEVFRFVQSDVFLAGRLKDTRHLLAKIASSFPGLLRLQARDRQTDVGRSLTGEREYQREDLGEILGANLNRATEAARLLEEFGKLVQPEIATLCESMRYQIYDLQKACELAFHYQQSMNDIRICVLVETGPSNEAFSNFVTGLGDWPKMIQLRDKHADDSTLLERGRLLGKLTQDTPSIWIMNDRCDLAVASDADGVHLGQEDLSVSEARRIVGPDRIIGVSTHNMAQAETAVLDGAGYIGVGPTFPSQTKSFNEFAGLEFVSQVANTFSLPAFAIGGINDTNIQQVLEAGGTRVAVTQAAKDSDALEAIRVVIQARRASE